MRWLLLLPIVACSPEERSDIDANPIEERDVVGGCSDGRDNDNDLMVDCEDPDCSMLCDTGNLPPHSTVVTIEPAEPTTHDDLRCLATAFDPNGDPLEFPARWYLDGTRMADGEVLPAEMTTGYDHWTCEVIPFDGELDGLTGRAEVDIRSDNRCTALAFGQNDRVQVPRFSGQDLAGTDFTLEAWVWIEPVVQSSNIPILFSDPQADLSGWRMVVVGDPGERSLRLQLGGGVPYLPAITSPAGTVPDDEWVHLAISHEVTTGSVRMHVNGTRVDEDVLDARVQTGESVGDLAIGGTLEGGLFHLIGAVDEVRISTVARYHDDFAPLPWFEPEPGTLAIWHLDEGIGDVATELGGLDGLISGAAWTPSSPCDAL